MTEKLLALMSALRDPDTGCAWDIRQTFKSIAPYTVEEAYEVADAIARDNMTDLKEELGDLLLQVVFHAQMASEAGAFSYDDVVQAICDKLIRRHPHVFGAHKTRDEAEIKAKWNEIKRLEKPREDNTFFADITKGFPPILKADKIQKRVSEVGFDWDNIKGVVDKVKEELAELEVEIEANDKDKQEAELGDLLFAITNLARHLKINPEQALARTNEKFMARFLEVEKLVYKPLHQSNLEEMEAAWYVVKSRR
jgi:nucleoside triphosphate diphosphatase